MYRVKWVPSHCSDVLIKACPCRDSAAQMTNQWVTGTRWDKSKYLQCSGSSISRLVTVNILAMSQWNMSCGHFVALSLAECEATCPPGSYDGLIWASRVTQPQDQLCGLPATWSWDSCRIGGGMMKKGSCCQSACATQTQRGEVTSEAVSWLGGVRSPSPSDSTQRECIGKIEAWGTLMLSDGLWWVNMMQCLNFHEITELSSDFPLRIQNGLFIVPVTVLPSSGEIRHLKWWLNWNRKTLVCSQIY